MVRILGTMMEMRRKTRKVGDQLGAGADADGEAHGVPRRTEGPV